MDNLYIETPTVRQLPLRLNRGIARYITTVHKNNKRSNALNFMYTQYTTNYRLHIVMYNYLDYNFITAMSSR